MITAVTLNVDKINCTLMSMQSHVQVWLSPHFSFGSLHPCFSALGLLIFKSIPIKKKKSFFTFPSSCGNKMGPGACCETSERLFVVTPYGVRVQTPFFPQTPLDLSPITCSAVPRPHYDLFGYWAQQPSAGGGPSCCCRCCTDTGAPAGKDFRQFYSC